MTNDQTIQSYLSASQAVIDNAIADARQADPEDWDALAGLMRQGGLLKLVSTFAPLTGLALMQIVVCEPNGIEHTLSQCELQRSAA